MSSRLNLPDEGERFKEFCGREMEQMPKLIAEGRVPLSVNGLMQRRLEIRNASDDVKAPWDSYFDTGDAIVYHPDGRIKIVLDSQYLREMTSDTKRSGGALVLTLEQYDTMDGEEFEERKFGGYRELPSRKEVKDHPIWKFLARDQGLLDDYTDLIFREKKDAPSMRVLTTSINRNFPGTWMRSWTVLGLDHWSDAYGGGALDHFGQFVGVEPEVSSLVEKL